MCLNVLMYTQEVILINTKHRTNYNRKKWNKLIKECMENKVDSIIVTHKDRFIRFRYD